MTLSPAGRAALGGSVRTDPVLIFVRLDVGQTLKIVRNSGDITRTDGTYKALGFSFRLGASDKGLARTAQIQIVNWGNIDDVLLTTEEHALYRTPLMSACRGGPAGAGRTHMIAGDWSGSGSSACAAWICCPAAQVVVKSIECQGESWQARVTVVPEAPEVHTLDQEPLPPYDVRRPADHAGAPPPVVALGLTEQIVYASGVPSSRMTATWQPALGVARRPSAGWASGISSSCRPPSPPLQGRGLRLSREWIVPVTARPS